MSNDKPKGRPGKLLMFVLGLAGLGVGVWLFGNRKRHKRRPDSDGDRRHP
jgi:hypothetical protein